ncbi:MAG: hypothetical protein V1736_09690 [Pseudomonadota bacterium]
MRIEKYGCPEVNAVELRNLTPDFLSTILGERKKVRGKEAS